MEHKEEWEEAFEYGEFRDYPAKYKTFLIPFIKILRQKSLEEGKAEIKEEVLTMLKSYRVDAPIGENRIIINLGQFETLLDHTLSKLRKEI